MECRRVVSQFAGTCFHFKKKNDVLVVPKGLFRELEHDKYCLVEEGPIRRMSGLVSDPINEDEETESVTTTSRDQRAEELQVFWSYIVGMLTNLESLPLDRIFQMLKMFAMQGPSAVECSIEELRSFLDSKVRDHQLIVSVVSINYQNKHCRSAEEDKEMGSTEFLCLRWNEFEANIKNVFTGLRKDEEFFDVTLACGPKQIKAHKIILCAFSPTLRSIIKSVPHSHPLLYLRSVQFHHLESLISFMYNGEVNVSQEDLEDFLSVAEELQIRGLVQNRHSTPSSALSDKEESTSTSSSIHPNKKRTASASNIQNTSSDKPNRNLILRPRLSVPSELISTSQTSSSQPQQHQPTTSAEESELEDINSVENEQKYTSEHPVIVSLDPDDLGKDDFTHGGADDDDLKNEEDDYAEYGSELHEMSSTEEGSMMDADLIMPEPSRSLNTSANSKDLLDVCIMKFASSQRNDKGNFKCLKCSYETPRLMDLKRHIESKHFVTDGFPCETCGFRSKTRYGLYRHRTRNHKMDLQYFSTM
ncbi:unnamed protein product [Lepeophtheirus salmonis]|nr:unnamed protein product [Lepeophtheirus salmonis]CAF2858741.1 unnamed protein product [Lepeophtheirus salmonis]